MTYKRKKEVDMIDQATGQPIRNPDGSIRKETIEVTVPTFRVANVFDISQTSGPPLPTLVDELEGNVERYQDFVQVIRNISPVPVNFEDMEVEKTPFECRKIPEFQKYFDILWKEIDNNDIR